jgi:hypothetical protein
VITLNNQPNHLNVWYAGRSGKTKEFCPVGTTEWGVLAYVGLALFFTGFYYHELAEHENWDFIVYILAVVGWPFALVLRFGYALARLSQRFRL